MANFLKGFVLAVILFLALAVLPSNEYTYTNDAIVISNNEGVIDAEDSDGNIWEWFSEEDIRTGDEVTLVMHNNYTFDNVYDDTIEKVVSK